MRKLTYFVLGLFLFVSCHEATQKNGTLKPKNIILLIGDGMGTAQITAAFIKNQGQLNLERCSHSGFLLTYSASHLITDSGAGGTALACGVKTTNQFIGVKPDSTYAKSILEYAEEHHKATALIAASSVTHATPASFIAHTESRYNYEDIAADYLKTDIDIFIGGGLDHFIKRQDSINLVEALLKKDYEVAYSIDQVLKSDATKIAGLLYNGHPPKYSEGRNEMLKLAGMKAIEILNQNENGFFMMIEGSQIDWAGHDEDNDYVIAEMIDFDNTIGAMLDFAEKDGETLVIITADHETGGYAITDGDLKSGVVKGEFISYNHTATMVPIFAFGPGAENFTGMMENTDIFKKMYQLFGF